MKRAALLLSLLASCRAVGWEGQVQVYGSLREALALGQSQARVRVADVASGGHLIGIGVLAGLEGEITIANGATWIARADAQGRVASLPGMALEDQATFLVLTSVPEWLEVPVDSPVELADLGRWAGFGALEWPMVPFIVRGTLIDLDAHVLRGACPQAGAVPPGKEPVRHRAARSFGTLAGFWARDGAGVVTHAGQDVHAHVILQGETPFSGHVERVRIGAGATLLVPRPHSYISPQFALGRSY